MTEREPTSDSRAEEGSDGSNIASTRNGDYFIKGVLFGSSERRRLPVAQEKKASMKLRPSETTILYNVIHLATPDSALAFWTV